ncbi:DUF4846 domain-containing protein [Patiriisocius hiemis]|uniref:DUF4846 domain-containing protein n=1 Tax=Patiriisocius hiemis TaxID=3075604 RepID=A0ABU2YEA9_9FLAO|nr:DUF4846 domain-containing protein [Constantimarinum sp. W242]MDT0556524.1 DUF4846 domain-containing protein [Constantimarinum sp. W242]
MKKILFFLFIAVGIGFFFFNKKGKVIKNVAKSYVLPPNYINKEGMTISERIKVPEGYSRASYPEGSFSKYIQDYVLKPFDAKVINYDGNPYVYQSGHVGVLEVPVPSNGLQQCADALIRLRAEYLWDTNRKDDIGFNFTSGHYCSWKKYSEGYRPKINGSKVSFHRTASRDTSKQNFYKYLNLIYTYAGTQSLYDELPKITNKANVEVGDMLIYPGSPGHVIMVVDKITALDGDILFIFAQGNTPAQSVHILKNLSDNSISPWYDIEMNQYLEIPTYYFNKTQFIRFK